MKRFIINSRFFMLSAFCFVMVITGCKKDLSDLPGDPQQLAAKKGSPGEPHLLVGDLKELQGSTVGPDQALYVTAPLEGSIYRVNPTTGAVTLFATGLPKRNPDPFFLGAGVIDVVFRGETAYALVTGVGTDLGEHDIVGIYRVDGPNSNTVIADIGQWSIDHPPVPEFFVPTGFQYSFEAYRDGFVVTDGHHNRVLNVRLDGEITEMIAFSDIVPTGLEQRGNTIYVTEAGPIPHLPKNAKLMSFTPGSPATEVATATGLGVGLFVDVEFGLGNTLFVLAQGVWDGPYEGAPALPNTGALLVLNSNNSFEVVANGLNLPTSVEFIGNTAYVISLAGEIWQINNCSAPPYGH